MGTSLFTAGSDQAGNVSELELAWSFSTENFGTTVDYANPSTPLEINGVLYANIANTRNVVALDATSGQVLWLYRYDEGDRYDEAPRKGPGRGVAFYSKGDKQRVIDISPGYQMVSLMLKPVYLTRSLVRTALSISIRGCVMRMIPAMRTRTSASRRRRL